MPTETGIGEVVDCYSRLVQIEFVELAGLVEARRSGTPWVLTLHDVLLSGNSSSDEDRFEAQAHEEIRRHRSLLATRTPRCSTV